MRTPAKVPLLPTEMWAQFMSFVIIGDCWQWDGVRTVLSHGYGRFTYKGVKYVASRLAYRQYYGEIPANLFVLHRCDNRACVRPSHLFLGTYSDNAIDREQKGRGGDTKKRPHLTKEQVATIRQLGKTQTQTAIAKQFGLSQTNVGKIINNETWVNVNA